MTDIIYQLDKSVTLVAVLVVAFLIVAGAIVLFKTFKREQPGEPALEGAQQASAPREWPGRTIIWSSIIFVYLISLLTIWSISVDMPESFTTENHIIGEVILNADQLLMTIVAVLWISISLSRSFLGFISNLTFFAIQLFALLTLVLYRTPSSFWLCVGILVVIGIRELRGHLIRQPVLTAIAQVLLVAIAFIQGLHLLTRYLVPEIATGSYGEFLDAIFRLRIVIAILFTSAVLLGTAINTFRNFSFQYHEFFKQDNVHFILIPIYNAINLLVNFLRMVGLFFATVFREAIRFIWRIISSWDLWRTLLNIGLTAVCLFVLAVDVLIIRPDLFAILRRPSVLIQPDSQLIWSNVYVAIAFVAAMLAIFVLARIWRPRGAEALQAVDSRIVTAAGAIYVCTCFATLTYFQVLNYVLGLHDVNLSWPGFYAAFVCILAAFFVLRENFSGPDLQPAAPVQGGNDTA
jgi:hypothetical protein